MPKNKKKSQTTSPNKSRRSLSGLEREKIRKLFRILIDSKSITLPLKIKTFKNLIPATLLEEVTERIYNECGEAPKMKDVTYMMFESVRACYRK